MIARRSTARGLTTVERLNDLSPYDRVTVSLWARSQKLLSRQPEGRCLSEAASHAVLVGLRDCQSPTELFARYASDVAPEFALIGSLLPSLESPTDETLWRVRDAAFHVRWQELLAEGKGTRGDGVG